MLRMMESLLALALPITITHGFNRDTSKKKHQPTRFNGLNFKLQWKGSTEKWINPLGQDCLPKLAPVPAMLCMVES